MNLLDSLNNGRNTNIFKPSDNQVAIFNFMRNSNAGNGITSAVAGSGKTTTLIEALKVIEPGKKAIYAAFNKSIVEEIKMRIPNGVDIQTMHAIGLAAIKGAYGYKIKLDGRKYNTYIKTFDNKWQTKEIEKPNEYRKRIHKLCDLLRQSVCAAVGELYQVATKNGVEFEEIDLERAFEVVEIASDESRFIDFVDMLYYPIKHNLPLISTYDWVLIDECQDLNRAQQELVMRLLRKEKRGAGTEAVVGRWLAVGDPGQAIYGFAGADTDSYSRLRSLADIELPLSTSYRCSQEVVRLAQTINPLIQSSPTAPVGIVNHKGKLSDIKDGDFVLCRNTAPLIDVCLKFIGMNRKAYIIGSDIGKTVIELIDRTLESLISNMFIILDQDRDELIQSLWEKGYTTEEALESELMQRYDEKIQIIRVIWKANRFQYTHQLVAKINEIFNDDNTKSGIIFSTIHKAKGLESHTVHIICKELMPNPRATKDWELQQERNLMYVAYTRAKHTLNFVEDYKFINI